MTQDRGITHYYGCWREHPQCAQRLLKQLHDLMATGVADLISFNGKDWFITTSGDSGHMYEPFEMLEGALSYLTSLAGLGDLSQEEDDHGRK